MGALSRISISWPEPFVRMLSFASAMNWEVIKLGCVVTMTLVMLLQGFWFLPHAGPGCRAAPLAPPRVPAPCDQLLRMQAPSLPSLFAALGTVFLMFFMSISSCSMSVSWPASFHSVFLPRSRSLSAILHFSSKSRFRLGSLWCVLVVLLRSTSFVVVCPG